ncbi:MAG: LysR family transcriptional regulator [Lachnospiraceae bacterium]|nr:LysR family transcriptional regulator [Lachnospiraceae bacterium]
MNESQLKCFISVQNHQNFTKAAEECHVVQATVSRQIAALEEELGCRLFERDSHGVHATPAGNTLAIYAPVLLEYQKTVADRVRNSTGEEQINIRIGIGPYEALLIRPILKQLVQLFPSIKVDMTAYTYQVLMTRYRNDILDLAVCNELCVNFMPKLIPQKLYDEAWQVAAAKDSPLWKLDEPERGLLKEQTVITLVNDQYDSVRSHCIKHRLGKRMIETNFLITQLELVNAGLGIAILPPFVQKQLPPGVVMRDILKIPFSVPFYAMFSPPWAVLFNPSTIQNFRGDDASFF